MRLGAEVGADGSLYTDLGTAVILSPDGTRLAFCRQRRRPKAAHLCPLTRPIANHRTFWHGECRQSLFSPDGQWIGFFADGKLKKISVRGGAAVTLCDAPVGVGGSWSEDGTRPRAMWLRSKQDLRQADEGASPLRYLPQTSLMPGSAALGNCYDPFAQEAWILQQWDGRLPERSLPSSTLFTGSKRGTPCAPGHFGSL